MGKSPTKSPTNTKSQSGKSAIAANQATKKPAKPAKNATTPTSQQQDQTSGSPSSAVLRNQRAAKRGNNDQGSDEKTIGTIPKKLKTSKVVDPTGGTTEQEEPEATTDEKVDPPEEAKDTEGPAAKSTKVPTDPEAPAAMSDDKSSGENSDEKQTTDIPNPENTGRGAIPTFFGYHHIQLCGVSLSTVWGVREARYLHLACNSEKLNPMLPATL
jgi:hypothetical protein